ncbi:hypothetical protein [Sphingobium boeckii]|uniref:Type II secretory pathway component PulJ n=1 Tax=Sphingobium boeckii TaxID=1082345 RepID=A0A7W9AFZ3_9SPHN|nr:hypothetical protein [Sphingobium boeckii]MBB5684915.1 type II secretory pathway component PulJ [Sphingobium boeckii]
MAPTTLADVYSLGRLLGVMLPAGDNNADLRAIIARASATDPADRYQTVDAMADDIRAFRGGFAVQARQGGRSYIAGRFIARHRKALIAAAAAAALLAGAFVISLSSYLSAERARAAEVQRFTELRSLAGYLLFDLNGRLERIPGNTQARAALAAEAQQHLNRLAKTNDADRALRLETANGLIKLAEIQGVGNYRNLGYARQAKESLTAAEAQLDAIVTAHGADSAVAGAYVRALSHRAVVQLHADKNAPGAEASLNRASRTLNNVPKNLRGAEWMDARRVLRRAQFELLDLEERPNALRRIASLASAEIGQWPANRPETADQTDRAYIAYYRGIADYVSGTRDHGTAYFLSALAGFKAIEQKEKNDPQMLYIAGWSAYMGFAAAAEAKQQARSSALIAEADSLVRRLLFIDDQDDSALVLSRDIGEALAQDLANRGHFAEAIAAQRTVVENAKAYLVRWKGIGIDLAYNELILGDIARKAGNRSLTCESWISAEKRFTRIEASGKLLEFHKAYLPALRGNVGLCVQGAATTRFKPLRG